MRIRTEALRVQTARYRELVENANDVIYTLDTEGRFTSINRTGERITGYRQDALLVRALDQHRPVRAGLLA